MSSYNTKKKQFNCSVAESLLAFNCVDISSLRWLRFAICFWGLFLKISNLMLIVKVSSLSYSILCLLTKSNGLGFPASMCSNCDWLLAFVFEFKNLWLVFTFSPLLRSWFLIVRSSSLCRINFSISAVISFCFLK